MVRFFLRNCMKALQLLPVTVDLNIRNIKKVSLAKTIFKNYVIFLTVAFFWLFNPNVF